MLDAYIIEKLKKEEQEQNQWQPVPLPLEEYDPFDRIDRKEEQKDDQKDTFRGVMIFQLQSSRDSKNIIL